MMPLHSTYHGCSNWTSAGCVCHAPPDYDTLAAELARLTAEVERLRADAGRYRWVLENATVFFIREQRIEVAPGKLIYSRCPTTDELTPTIDLAIKEAGNG